MAKWGEPATFFTAPGNQANPLSYPGMFRKRRQPPLLGPLDAISW
jgi:hypothetical protein